VSVAATPQQILDRLDGVARRGRLAGFAPGEEGVLFRTDAFGTPFDGDLEARAETDGAATTLRFSTRMHRKWVWILVAVLLVSIWPGTPITKSLLASLVPSWRWLWETTVYWYLPLAVIGAPWTLWSAVSRSRREIAVSAVEMVGKVQKELAGFGKPGAAALPERPAAAESPG